MFEEQTSSYWASNMMFPSCLSNVPSNGTWQLSVGGCCWFSDTIFRFKFQSSGDDSHDFAATSVAGEGTTTPRQVSKARMEEQRVHFFLKKNIYKEARHIICIFFCSLCINPWPISRSEKKGTLLLETHFNSHVQHFDFFSHLFAQNISATSRINHLHTKCSRICKTAWSWL